MLEMTAALTTATGSAWTIVDAQLDEPRDNEVLVRIVATGVCHTDVSVRDQHIPLPLPAVLGHEGAGIVEAVGSRVSGLEVGDHVVLASSSCGECPYCLKGLPNYCVLGMSLNFSGRRPDGSALIRNAQGEVSGAFFGQSSFATYSLVSQRSAVKIPKDVPLELMGPLGCGLLTGAGTVINLLTAGFGDSIAVFGAGAVGLAAIMAARLVGCSTIIAVDLHENRLNLAKELGATHVINAGAIPDVAKAVHEVNGKGADYVIDATGVASVATSAIASLAPNGRCVLLGVYPPDAVLPIPAGGLFFGQTVGGSLSGNSIPQVFIPQLVEMWRQGRFPFDRMVKFFDFEQINDAVEQALSGEVLKPVLRMPKSSAPSLDAGTP